MTTNRIYEGPLNECNECHRKLNQSGQGFYVLRTDVWLERIDDTADLYGASRTAATDSDDDDDDDDVDDNEEAGSYEKPTQTYQFNLCKHCYEAFDQRLQQQER